MKKLMMGTAVAALVAGGASAQEWAVDVGGVFIGGFAYVDIDDELDGQEFQIVRDPELVVNARLVADNGITFGVRTEIEGADTNERIDENYGYVSGSFGEFQIGEADGAKDNFHYFGYVNAPWTSAGDGVGLLFDGQYYAGDAGISLDALGGDTGDDLKITYFTPSFSGFSAGVSYIPRTSGTGFSGQQGRSTERTSDSGDAVEVGAGYEGTFGDFSVGAGIGYFEAPEDTTGIGGSIKGGFGGFELGVAYGYNETDDANGVSVERNIMQVGATYSTGPWIFGGDIAFDVDDFEIDVPGTPQDEEIGQYGIGVGMSYALAPGVSVGLSGEYADADDLNDVDNSFAIGSWLGLRF